MKIIFLTFQNNQKRKIGFTVLQSLKIQCCIVKVTKCIVRDSFNLGKKRQKQLHLSLNNGTRRKMRAI